ncbi:MAG: signal peptidase I [Oryzihumus sp.]
MRAPSPSARMLRRALTWLRRGLTTVAVVAAAATVLGLGLLQHSGRQLLIVTSGSMVPTFSPGDVVIIEQHPVAQLRAGMVITFQAPGSTGELTSHRIRSVEHLPEGVFFRTKGDANRAPDPNLAPAANVRGVMTGTVPYVGRWLAFYQSPRGRVVILGGPLLMMALSQCLALWRGARRLRAARASAPRPAATGSSPAESTGAAAVTARHTGEGDTRAERRARARALASARRRLIVGGVATTLAIASGLGVFISRHTNAQFTDAATVADNTFTTAANFCAGSAYARAVCADDPLSWFRMDEPNANDSRDDFIVHDSGSARRDGVRLPGVTRGQASALAADPADHAYAFSGGLVGASPARGLPAAFTVELLFRAPSGNTQPKDIGGPLVSLGHLGADWKGHVDAAVYLTKGGMLAFGTDVGNGNGKKTTGESTTRLDDGLWHHVVATRSTAGLLSLYVDGAPVFTGLPGDAGALQDPIGLVAGYSSLNSWLDAPIPDSFTGTVDEVAFYGTALSKDQVVAHYRASGLSR